MQRSFATSGPLTLAFTSGLPYRKFIQQFDAAWLMKENSTMVDQAMRARPTQNQGTGVSFERRNLPLMFGMFYLISVFSIFLVWPINWPLYDYWAWVSLTVYVSFCFGALAVGYRFGSRPLRIASNPQSYPLARVIIAAGAIAAVLLLAPTSYIYTGRWPWQVMTALQDQGEAYKALYAQLSETTGQRGPIALARAIVAPVTFAVLPLGILNWQRLTGLQKTLVIATVFCSIILSIMRGTDREFADIFIVAGSAFMVLIARQSGMSGRVAALLKKYWLPAVILLVFLLQAASLFTERKTSRLGSSENLTFVCANSSDICADMNAPLIAWMPAEQRFGASIFVLSSASGFYGLALGMEKKFEPTWGFGHSPASLAVYTLLTGDDTLRYRTYTYRNGIDAWSDENYWSTLILWIANDVGFFGAVVVLGLLGLIWGKSWRDAVVRRNDPAGVLFCLTMIMIAYLPANNQVFALYEGYSIFFVWLFLWSRENSRSKADRNLSR